MSPFLIAAIGLTATSILFVWSCILRRRRTRQRLLRWASILRLAPIDGENNTALRARILAETERQEAQLAAANQARATKESRCSKCSAYLMYSARQRGDGLCGMCSRIAAGKPTTADRMRSRWGKQ